LYESNPEAYKKQFKDLYRVVVDTYNEKKNSILLEEGSEIKRRLEQAKINYQKVFNPEGFTSAGNSYFVVDYNVAARDIIGQLKSSNDRKEIDRLLDLFQQQFLNKYPKNTDITQYLRPINVAINKWNFANRDKQEPLALLTVFKP
jgi:predicted amidophosphoribosyltransferase